MKLLYTLGCVANVVVLPVGGFLKLRTLC